MARLYKIVQDVSQATTIEQASKVIVAGVREAMRVDVCSVYLTDSEQEFHLLIASEGLSQDVVGQLKLGLNEGLVGLVCERSEPVNIRDAPSHPRNYFVPDSGDELYHGFLGVPIVHQGKLLGILVVQQLLQRRFKQLEVAFLATLAAQLAGGFALARIRSAVSGDGPAQISVRPYIEGGVGAPGIALGTGVVLYSPSQLDQVPDRDAEDIEREVQVFVSAVKQVSTAFEDIGNNLGSLVSPEDRALFGAYAMIARSDEIVESTIARIKAGNWAPGALRDVIRDYAQVFEAMEDPYLKERANDIRDIGRRLLTQLLEKEQTQVVYPEKTVLIGDNISAIDLAAVPRERLVGVVSGHGSSMSHLAILSRSLGVPAVMGVATDIPTSALDGQELIIDGYQGRIYIEPTNAVRKEYGRLIRQERELTDELKRLRDLPAISLDGVRTVLNTNIGLLSDINQSQSVGSEGVGLFRSEFPFMVRNSFPTEDDQYNLYRKLLEPLAPQQVTLRTLDIGGDKALPYFPIQESNPFLGWRGIRISLDHPDIFLTQIRAALRADIGLGNLKILLPMISSIDDLDQAIALVHRAYEQLKEEGFDVTLPPIGAMIEVPAAVYLANAIAQRVDFMSVGTNDLIQYLLAVDRNNERVIRWFDPLHPSVIAALLQIVEAGKRHNKPVSVCGEAAGDPAVALLLLGMGVTSLSLNASDLPRVKWLVRSFSQTRCWDILQQALVLDKASAIRDMLTQVLIDGNLGGLTRPGK
ncbi:phosphoenolpyruvate--protein phosphotransferase [Motiliproteus sp. MSK22-1]|nr:phosphoenolpyruvate--protein phosphotransferase [Motiliproteus sp. MSK22-1]